MLDRYLLDIVDEAELNAKSREYLVEALARATHEIRALRTDIASLQAFDEQEKAIMDWAKSLGDVSD